jgi:nucleotide-binding universal stress UspA family protein/Icc-related predicted phosphoesterase
MSQNQLVQVLAISDRITGILITENAKEEFQNIELLLACGDIPYYYIENVMRNFGIPTFYVRGNHDNLEEFGTNGIRREPVGAINLDSYVTNHNNILMVGFEGSVRYKIGPFMYTQTEMWIKVLNIIPKLIWNKLTQGRFIDIIISHAPPWGIYPMKDHVHQGFKAFNWLIKTFKPSYHFHGHIHIDRETEEGIHYLYQTKILNTYPFVQTVVQPGIKHYQIGASIHVPKSNLPNSLEDFRDARRKASLEIILDSLRRRPSNLLSFDEINEQIREKSFHKRGLQKIPLDAIVGSVGRYQDFTRKFFPRREDNKDRWVAIRKKFTSTETMLPIEVYQIGEVYFVVDGNHRVSVARQNGESYIQAYITQIETNLPLSPDDNPEDIFLKTRHINFIEKTKLNQLRPKVDFTLTAPGKYRQLSEHIAIHHYSLGLQTKKEVKYEDAVIDWVDNVYLPVIRLIRSQGLLREFKGRTPTDLFLWITTQQQNLAKEIGWEVDPTYIAKEIVGQHGSRPQRLWHRFKELFFEKLRPKNLDPGPPPGDWRKSHAIPRRDDRLFSSSLVAINGEKSGWTALEQAIIIAGKEKGHIHGVHITTAPKEESDKLQFLKDKFNSICDSESIPNDLFFEKGVISQKISNLARWNDLVVFPLNHPPEDRPISRLRSGLRNLIQSSPRPLLAVPSISLMNHALLAFDGSPKAFEALYLAAYFAENWGTKITVVSALDRPDNEDYQQAGDYLNSRQIKANYVTKSGHPGKVILETAEKVECDFIIMGGYSFSPIIEVALGSTVDQILLKYRKPILICR